MRTFLIPSTSLVEIQPIKRFSLVAAVAAATGLPISSVGLSRITNADHRPIFDIISVKPSPPLLRPSSPFVNDFKLWLGPDSHMILSNVTLAFLIKYAYSLHDDQLAGLSVWSKSKRWDVDAKCDPPVGGDPRTMAFDKRQAYESQMMLRLQSLLAERFHLKLRQETKVINAFALVVVKNGPKFMQSPPPEPDGQVKRGATILPGDVEIYQANMDILARMLSQFAGRTVLNRTALMGTYDLKLEWAPDSDSVASQSGPSLFTALQEQLGLKLESIKDSTPLLVVEEASIPDAN